MDLKGTDNMKVTRATRNHLITLFCAGLFNSLSIKPITDTYARKNVNMHKILSASPPRNAELS